MPAYRPPKIPSSEITPREVYLKRREFLGAATFGAIALYGAGKASAAALTTVKSKYTVDEKLTPLKDVTTYNFAMAHLRTLPLEQQELVDSITRGLMNKFLHQPLQMLKAAARSGMECAASMRAQ